ncbi:CDP-diacylglycerol/serine O-phosphatidyltransferase [Chloroherpeton thalassium ATCC 35110]|uniref:CDP-diacylglycerol--serine O-phosphatidyltransferase n=1 Tax=Chloroherpeton thalassium (strain ATCC 35110 / GB-78) TaxID=517418 RepID=B3QTD3_CHLT3|nr:CDP-diacylglycerol--serine O-phosphatidyltransferase [Chloroherpeton thalassium]ACF12679.1 CDP-diacylglycerol/serine O-phosphatidyltransferase [Chloroherpeton thalassium ATCC 35110]
MTEKNRPAEQPHQPKYAPHDAPRTTKRKFKMRKVQIPRVPPSAVPSAFTVMNMACGYVAIVMASQDSFTAAGWFIIFAAIFDTLDGFVARLTNASSEFGVELDSLSDLVSFGAAPSFLAYKFGLNEYGVGVGLGLSSLLMIGSGLRLARFNVQLVGFSKDYFSGLPTPSQAMTLATFVMWAHNEQVFFAPHLHVVLAVLTVLLAGLMVSKVRYDTLPKFRPDDFRSSPVKMSLYIISFICILIFQAKAFFIAMMMYILFGLIRSIYHFFSEETDIASENATTHNM